MIKAGERDKLLAEIEQLRARVAELEMEEAHIVECQQWLERNGYGIGGDGSLLIGMVRMQDQIDEHDAEMRDYRKSTDAIEEEDDKSIALSLMVALVVLVWQGVLS